MSYYALVDCNNFYVSCERLFNPQLEGRPVIALSNNDGCVIARSQEAKQLGIKMGEPYFKIHALCKQHNVFICSSNYTVYGEISKRVMNIIAQMSPEIQIYSIDEAFATFSHTFLEKDIVAHCLEMKRLIKQWIGIPISVGIGPTKTLSKMANDLAKKQRTTGLFNLYSQSVQNEVLQNYPIQDVWGIGSRLGTKLRSHHIYTAAEFRDADPLYIRKLMGVVGERMLWELRGVSCLPLEEPSPKKSITCSRSFGKTVTDIHHLEEALATHVNRACIELREQNSYASAICIFIEAVVDSEGTRRPFSTVIPFDIPSHDTPVIIGMVKQHLPQIFIKGLRYKKCGVICLDLLPTSHIFPDLFQEGPSPRRAHLMDTVDAVNARFGKNTLFYGAMGINPIWQTRRERCSSNYTSDWNGLAIAKA